MGEAFARRRGDGRPSCRGLGGAVLALALLAAGCDRTELRLGEDCELNSDCASPLVCRLERCRVECRGTRDCAIGLLCIPDEDGVGACQLEDECQLASDCPPGLVCTDHRCTTECVADIDCPAGARCEAGPDGVLGCVDRSEESCQLSSDCAPGLRCAPDRRCREPCRADRDCRDGRSCLSMATGPTVCGLPRDPDLGVGDGGTNDGGPLDGGATDGGVSRDLGDGDGGPPPPSRGTLTAGTAHSCVFVSGTDARCWGQWRNPDASLIHFEYATPTAIALPEGPVALMSGASHGCAVLPSELRCWGDNTGGQLGQEPATLPFSETPVVVPLPFDVRAMGAGLAHLCVLAEGTGEVWCWGDNASGQLGHGGSGPDPVMVPLPMAAIDVAARNQNSCALLADGSVHCWGSNGSDQLGSGTAAAQSTTPIPIAGLANVVEVDVGSQFACARSEPGGEVRCWGSNGAGQLATGATGGTEPTPTLVTLPRPAVEIETGQVHACVRLDDGSVHCWGLNGSRQAGAPSGIFVTSPLEVVGSGATELTAGDNHGCYRSGPSTVACWGSNAQGQLGSAGPSTSTPMTVPGL